MAKKLMTCLRDLLLLTVFQLNAARKSCVGCCWICWLHTMHGGLTSPISSSVYSFYRCTSWMTAAAELARVVLTSDWRKNTSSCRDFTLRPVHTCFRNRIICIPKQKLCILKRKQNILFRDTKFLFQDTKFLFRDTNYPVSERSVDRPLDCHDFMYFTDSMACCKMTSG